MYRSKMCERLIIVFLLASSGCAQLFGAERIRSYVKSLNIGEFAANNSGNELWQGILRDCSNRTSFSCIQKNVYSYLDETFEDRDNITVFDGLVLTKNNLDYHKYTSDYNGGHDGEEDNLIEEAVQPGNEGRSYDGKEKIRSGTEDGDLDSKSPLEEVTAALHEKTVKFLATKDYEIQLPELFFAGAKIKISPKEVDDDGALIRVDLKEQRSVDDQGRFFKKIRKFIKSKLLLSFLALILIIKLIKVKFLFVVPFLFGVGAAKKLFLKVLLFLVPAFSHVFHLCSTYYSGRTKYHHHHHQIAHHHHHVPVPVPVYHHDHHDHHDHDEHEFEGYDYSPQHIQYRKDVEELKEWGIEPHEEAYGPYAHMGSASGSYGMPQYAANARPVNAGPPQPTPDRYASQIPYEKPSTVYQNPAPSVHRTLNNIGMGQYVKNFGGRPKVVTANLGTIGNHAQNLAYNGYFDDGRFTRAASPVTEVNFGKTFDQQYGNLQLQLQPAYGTPKRSGFTAKSDDVGSWSQSAENILRPQQAGKPTAQVPIHVHDGQQGTVGGQNLLQGDQQSQNSLANVRHVIQNIRNNREGQPQNLSANRQKIVPNVRAPQVAQNDPQNGPASNADTGKQQFTDVGSIRGIIYDDEFYGPILERLDETFKLLRFTDEECRARLVCSMYKNPTVYSPHSNLVSNELSRDPEEMKRGVATSASGRRFQRYLDAARSGQDRGDCLKLYPCHINTE